MKKPWVDMFSITQGINAPLDDSQPLRLNSMRKSSRSSDFAGTANSAPHNAIPASHVTISAIREHFSYIDLSESLWRKENAERDLLPGSFARNSNRTNFWPEFVGAIPTEAAILSNSNVIYRRAIVSNFSSFLYRYCITAAD